MTGLPTIFLRLGGCDFRCAWCDTPYAVLSQYAHEWKKTKAKDILLTLNSLKGKHWGYGPRGHVTVSGGNPALYELGWLVSRLKEHGIGVGVETQGSVYKRWLGYVDQLVISPKGPTAGNMTDISPGSPFDEMCLNKPNASIKVVVFSLVDFEYAEMIHFRYPRIPMFLQVGTNVGIDTRDSLLDKLKRLQEDVLSTPGMMDVRIMAQQHVLVHGHKRGI